MSDLPAIIGGLSLLIGAVFTGLIGLGQRRARIDRETLDELEQYHVWRPRVRRAIVALRDTLAEWGVPEPDGIDDLLQYPPPRTRPKHASKDEQVTADDPQ